MRAVVNEFNTEVAWHGTVVRDGLSFTVTDIIIYPQIVTSATVESDDAEYSKFLDTLPDEVYNAIRLQGHSHVNMGVTPSSVDWSYYEELLAHVPDFYITMITNKRSEVWVEIYDVAANIVYENGEISLIKETSDSEFLINARAMLRKPTLASIAKPWSAGSTTIVGKDDMDDYLRYLKAGDY
jgi:hypothetical protein